MASDLPFGPADWRSVIGTPRLLLVPLTRADASDLFPVLNDASLHRFIGGEPLTEAALTERYARLEAGTPANLSEVWANWVVRLRGPGTAIGFVQATISAEGADLAWVIGQAWQRRGFASEAVAAMAGWLVDAGVGKLVAHIHPENRASAHVARRAGLAPTEDVDADGEVVWRGPVVRAPAVGGA